MKNDGLTDKQKIFAREYLIDLNATQSSIRAGYSEKTAHVQGSRMLSNVKVQAYLTKLMNERAKRLEIKADNVLREIAKLAFSDINDLIDENGILIPLNKLNKEISSTLKIHAEQTDEGDFKYKYSSSDKKGSLELLGRHLKLFTDKVEVGGGLKTVKITEKRFDGTISNNKDQE